MKQILFTSQGGSQTMVTVDASTDNAGRYTILSIEKKVKGVDNDFEKLFPWNRGQVVEDADFQKWKNSVGGFFANITEYFIGGENTSTDETTEKSNVSIFINKQIREIEGVLKIEIANERGMRMKVAEIDLSEVPIPASRILLYTATTKPESTWITNNCLENVFDENTGEGYLVLNNGVDTLDADSEDNSIFNDSDDSNITTVIIPSQITTLGLGAFAHCANLISVNIPDSVTEIGSYAFSRCANLISVNIPDSVTEIGSYAFSRCSSLKSINIPDSVTEIDNYAFSECSGLTSITIPNSVTTIGVSAFEECSALTSVIISNSVTSIGDDAFVNCTSLASVTCFATTPPTLGAWAFQAIDTTICSVPASSISAYQNDASWSAVFFTFIAIPGTEGK